MKNKINFLIAILSLISFKSYAEVSQINSTSGSAVALVGNSGFDIVNTISALPISASTGVNGVALSGYDNFQLITDSNANVTATNMSAVLISSTRESNITVDNNSTLNNNSNDNSTLKIVTSTANNDLTDAIVVNNNRFIINDALGDAIDIASNGNITINNDEGSIIATNGATAIRLQNNHLTPSSNGTITINNHGTIAGTQNAAYSNNNKLIFNQYGDPQNVDGILFSDSGGEYNLSLGSEFNNVISLEYLQDVGNRVGGSLVHSITTDGASYLNPEGETWSSTAFDLQNQWHFKGDYTFTNNGIFETSIFMKDLTIFGGTGTVINNGNLGNTFTVYIDGATVENNGETRGTTTVATGTFNNNSGGTIYQGIAISEGTLNNKSGGSILTSVLVSNSSVFNNESGAVLDNARITLQGNSVMNNRGEINLSGPSVYIRVNGNSTLNNNGSGNIVSGVIVNVSNVGDSAATVNNNNSATIHEVTVNSGGTLNQLSTGAIDIVAINGGTLHQQSSGEIGNVTLTSGVIINDATRTINAIVATGGTITNSGIIQSLKLLEGQTLTNLNNSGTINAISSGEDDSGDLTFTNTLHGSGDITKIGSGLFSINGLNNTHSGHFFVNGGELKVNGTTASQVVVNNSALLSGTGTIGSLVVNNGGRVGPGNSIGTLNVVGDVNLNAGSISDFEFNQNSIDKIIAGGDINIANGAAINFSLYNTAGGYFVVDQNILETTNGEVSGQYSSIATPSNYIANLQYGAQEVRATIATKIDSNAIDGTLASQNTIGRILSKTVFDRIIQDCNCDETKVWFSTGGFNNERDAVANASKHSSSGNITSAGLTKTFDDFQLIGGLFSANADVTRYNFSGSDEIQTNGGVIGIGKNISIDEKSIFLLAQIGAGFYDLDNKRYVNVNGQGQAASGSGKGNISFISLGASYKLPLEIKGSVELFATTRLQRTTSNGWRENGLSAGNLHFARSYANSMNYEIGGAYQDNFTKFWHLPQDSFYKIELSGYKTTLNSKKNALVTMNSASYSLAPSLEDKLLFAANAAISIPVNADTNIIASLGQRKNGNYKENNGNIGIEVRF